MSVVFILSTRIFLCVFLKGQRNLIDFHQILHVTEYVVQLIHKMSLIIWLACNLSIKTGTAIKHTFIVFLNKLTDHPDCVIK